MTVKFMLNEKEKSVDFQCFGPDLWGQTSHGQQTERVL